MSLVKSSNRISPFTNSFLTEFFNTDRLFNDEFFTIGKLPAVNVVDNDKSFNLEVAVPGMKKEDFHIDISNGMIIISAEHKEESEKKEKNYTRKEFSCESFERMFTLPENVNEIEIDAAYKDGILFITIPKKEIAVIPKRAVAVK